MATFIGVQSSILTLFSQTGILTLLPLTFNLILLPQTFILTLPPQTSIPTLLPLLFYSTLIWQKTFLRYPRANSSPNLRLKQFLLLSSQRWRKERKYLDAKMAKAKENSVLLIPFVLRLFFFMQIFFAIYGSRSGNIWETGVSRANEGDDKFIYKDHLLLACLWRLS